MKCVEEIIKKMCDIISVDYNSIDYNKKNWFLEHSWSKEQEEEFKKWLTIYVKSNPDAQKFFLLNDVCSDYSIDSFVEAFVFSYGWKNESC